MTNDLISREAALEIIMKYCPDDDGSCSKADADLREMLDEIENIPAVDTVPVVHCKDCKYRGATYVCPFRHIVFTEAEGYHFADCTTDDGYCSFGTHKEADNAQA